MTRIVNHTWSDPRTLNVDIDHLSSDFETVIRQLLIHIGYPTDVEEREKLVSIY